MKKLSASVLELLPKCVFIAALLLASSNAEKPRVVILTDITNEPDDQMSLVRLLTYSNEIDVEGIIATTGCWKMSNPDANTIRSVIEAYRQAYPNLKLHSPDYPAADYLLSITKSGVNGYGMSATESQLENEGVKHIISVLDKPDTRPVWFAVWGGANTLGGAVMKIKNTRGVDAQKLIAKIRGYEIALQDDGFAYIMKQFPSAKLISSCLQWKAISRTIPSFNAWPESWGGNNDVFDAQWVSVNVQNGHGPLGQKYPTAKYLHEGDSPSFLYLIPNGLNFPEFVNYGGWGGRFGSERVKNVRTGTGNGTVDGLLGKWNDYYLYSDTSDSWAYNGTTYTNNRYCPIFRWREDFQNDFAARMDRCIRPFSEVNHAPIAVVNNDTSRNLLSVSALPGSQVTLDAAGSSDPDNNSLSYSFWTYKEPGTYTGNVEILDAASSKATVRVPSDAMNKNLHVILTVKDNGNPPLVSYRRVVITGATSTAVSGLTDGQFTKSTMRTAEIQKPAVFVQNGHVHVAPNYPGTVSVHIRDLTGRKLQHMRIDGYSTAHFQIHGTCVVQIVYPQSEIVARITLK